jgi:hypothetical protein
MNRTAVQGRTGRFIPKYRGPLLIFFSAIAVLSYGYLSHPPSIPNITLPPAFLQVLEGDYPLYAWRFLCSFVFMGILPVLIMVILKVRPHEAGIVAPRPLFYRRIFYLPLGIGLIIFALMNAYSPNLYNFYPYAQSLVDSTAARGGWPFLLHAAAYGLLFYLPWELTFRGLLLLPFAYSAARRPHISLKKWEFHPLILPLALFQIIPSALLHFGHPYLESLGALAFGLLMALVVLRTRSVVWPVIFHSAAGILMDLFIILRKLEVMP